MEGGATLGHALKKKNRIMMRVDVVSREKTLGGDV